MIISAYCINKDGILVYSGLPVSHNDLTWEHHNGEQYRKSYRGDYLYEVYASGETPNGEGYIRHGRTNLDDNEYTYMLLGNTWRLISNK